MLAQSRSGIQTVFPTEQDSLQGKGARMDLVISVESTTGAQTGWRTAKIPSRFQPPLGKPDVQFSCIRLSLGVSCLRPRKVTREWSQVYKSQ